MKPTQAMSLTLISILLASCSARYNHSVCLDTELRDMPQIEGHRTFTMLLSDAEKADMSPEERAMLELIRIKLNIVHTAKGLYTATPELGTTVGDFGPLPIRTCAHDEKFFAEFAMYPPPYPNVLFVLSPKSATQSVDRLTALGTDLASLKKLGAPYYKESSNQFNVETYSIDNSALKAKTFIAALGSEVELEIR